MWERFSVRIVIRRQRLFRIVRPGIRIREGCKSEHMPKVVHSITSPNPCVSRVILCGRARIKLVVIAQGGSGAR